MLGFTGDRTGLTEGATNRYQPRTNRSVLIPSFEGLYKSNHQNLDKTGLHGRLEELLVFEILKDGETDYHRFTVRTLHKYVMQAIKSTRKEGVDFSMSDSNLTKQTSDLLDKLALGRAVVGGEASPAAAIGREKLTSIDEAEALEPPSVKENKENSGLEKLTYRERLGGYLHPRDMRKLVTPFSASNEPEVIVRRHAILLNFDPLRAIILRDRLLVVVPDGADSILVELEKRLRGGMETDRDVVYSEVEETPNGDEDREETTSKQADKGSMEFEAETDSTTDMPKDEAGDSNFVMDSGEEENQYFFDTFVENEWDELDGKDWIDLPFELQSLDSVLASVSSILADDVLELQYGANAIIVELLEPGSGVDDHSQEVLRQMKNSVQETMSRVDGFCRAIDELLEDYEDMALMNLSRLLTHPERFIQPVPQSILDEESDEPELILEAHLQRGHTLNNALRLVQGQITSTEDFAERKSDTIRNRLLYINLILTAMSLAVTFGSFIGSIFGMNVINPYEDSTPAFYVIAFGSLGFMVCFVVFVMFTIRKLGALPNVI